VVIKNDPPTEVTTHGGTAKQPDAGILLKMSTSSPPEFNSRTSVRFLSASTGVLVALLAAGAFALSFDALKQLADENGVSPGLTWVWPLVLDGAIVAFSLSALRASLHCESASYPMALVVIATLTSVVFNVAHAPAGVLAHTMAAVPPVFLFLSFELLMRQLRGEVERREVLLSVESLGDEKKRAEAACALLGKQIEGLKEERQKIKAERAAVKSASVLDLLEEANRSKREKIQARRDRVAELIGGACDSVQIIMLGRRDPGGLGGGIGGVLHTHRAVLLNACIPLRIVIQVMTVQIGPRIV
jgi:FtsZ-binding cell division protein ZapB